MIHLTERLAKIASWVPKGSRAADIGTDHGYIPIWLKQSGTSEYIVASDINAGPLQKMQEHLERYLPDPADRAGIELRQGSGLRVLEPGEVDTAVLAGMGGLLMIDILAEDPAKTASLKTLILQPRNAPDKLRKWLLENGFRIEDEALVRESRFLWEILRVSATDSFSSPEQAQRHWQEYFGGSEVQYEVGQWLIRHRDPYLPAFIENKRRILREIAAGAAQSGSREARARRREVTETLRLLERIEHYVNH